MLFFLHLDHFQVPPPAPAEVKHEGPLGVKVEEKRGLEVVTMKRERDEEQEEGGIPSKRQRLEEGEVVPEESDGFSDSEVEQTLQGVEPSLGQLQGDAYDLLIWMAQLNIKFSGLTNLAPSCLPDFSLPTIQGEIPGLEDLMSSESKLQFFNIFLYLIFVSLSVFGPLLRLSPPPTEKDYCFNLDSNEGVCDLFDVL